MVYTSLVNPIKEIRKKLGMTQTECGAVISVSQVTWWRYEHIKEHLDLKYNTQNRIAKAFGMTHIELLLKRREMDAGEGDGHDA